jgi:CRISPR/Cas system-associated exonuclease Cas4 (RecB family)
MSEIFPDEKVQRIRASMDLIGLRHVSASQIGMYQRCPRQWAYRYVLGVKIPPNGALVNGSGVHAAAEQGMLDKLATHNNPDPEESATIAYEYVTKTAEAEEVILNDDEQIGEVADKSARIARTWASEAAPNVMPVDVEATINTDLAGIPVTGRLDVITEDTVIDWKTASRSPSQSDLISSIQTQIYQTMTSMPVRYVHLVDKKAGTEVVESLIPNDDPDSQQERTSSTVVGVAAGMALGVWPRNQQGWHCSARWCGYYSRCMAGRDDATLDDKAYESRAAAGVAW